MKGMAFVRTSDAYHQISPQIAHKKFIETNIILVLSLNYMNIAL